MITQVKSNRLTVDEKIYKYIWHKSKIWRAYVKIWIFNVHELIDFLGLKSAMLNFRNFLSSRVLLSYKKRA